jgi:hypothetical protein
LGYATRRPYAEAADSALSTTAFSATTTARNVAIITANATVLDSNLLSEAPDHQRRHQRGADAEMIQR